MTDTNGQSHAQRMVRKKAVIDRAIARASEDRGVLLVLTGNGKGKSSSAFGMVARALGHGMRVGVYQFLKGRRDTGEEAFLVGSAGLTWEVCGEGFTWETQDRARDVEVATRGWQRASAALADAAIDLVVLDELTYLLQYRYLEAESVYAALAARPHRQHVVVTGRAAPAALIELADTVSEIRDVKHAFRAGVRAQPGVDL
jgi:cob(I)alamin adenosyltransferase